MCVVNMSLQFSTCRLVRLVATAVKISCKGFPVREKLCDPSADEFLHGDNMSGNLM